VRQVLALLVVIFSGSLFAQSRERKEYYPFSVVPIEFNNLSANDLANIISDSTIPITLRDNVFIRGYSYSDASIGYRRYGIWREFTIECDPKSIRYQFTDIDHDRGNELVVTGNRADYGSGGGTTSSSIYVYKIDTAVTCILNLVYSFSEESFGRSSPGYTHTCEREVSVSPDGVRISPIISTKHTRKGGMEYEDLCGSIDSVKPGIYHWIDGRFQWRANYKKID
jgi:hypothetical protein